MYFIGKSALSTGCPFILSSNANLFCTEKGPGQLLFARLRLFDRHCSFQANNNPSHHG